MRKLPWSAYICLVIKINLSFKLNERHYAFSTFVSMSLFQNFRNISATVISYLLYFTILDFRKGLSKPSLIFKTKLKKRKCAREYFVLERGVWKDSFHFATDAWYSFMYDHNAWLYFPLLLYKGFFGVIVE